MNVSFLQELMSTVAEQSRALIPWAVSNGGESLEVLSSALLSGRGEASGVVLAQQILNRYRATTQDDRAAYFQFLARSFLPDPQRAAAAARDYAEHPTTEALLRLQQAVESPRQEFFRRLNLAPGATADIVAMRRDLLALLPRHPELTAVDLDLRHLLGSWFNRGFLVLKRIDWQTPAAILEKIIAYEAVHRIESWDDLRRRLAPADRRCFAFFHPSLVDEPLIFVEVALSEETASSIQQVLSEPHKGSQRPAAPTTAVFYSISNCQEGLRGISFGNFLIKQVAEELAREQPSLKTFVTLSPVPGFARWLAQRGAVGLEPLQPAEAEAVKALLAGPTTALPPTDCAPLKSGLTALAAEYFLVAKGSGGRPPDPVARFHLGNGASLDRINWPGDVSAKGLAESHGLMVNYRYELKDIERNHEAFANDGTIAASKPVRALLRAKDRGKVGGLKLPAPTATRS